MEDVGKIWMVRIGDHIRGPYETEAVKSLIAAQKVSEIDEVSLPCKSWSYIRDRVEFVGALQNLRSTSFTKPNTDSLTTSYTGTEDLNDRTQELTAAGGMETRTTPLADFEDLGVERKPLNLDELKSTARVVPNSKDQRSRSRMAALVFCVVALIGAGYYYGATQLDYNPMALLNKDYKAKFEMSWESGDYTEALKSLKARKSLMQKHGLEYAVLLLLKGNDFDSAGLALEQVVDKNSAEWKNAKGLIEFRSERFDSAESLFLSALEQSPAYAPALVNLGLLKRKSRDWTGARFYFEAAYSSFSEEYGQEEIAFYLVESWLQQIMKKDGLTQIEEVKAFLANRLLTSSTFSHELMLVDLWIDLLSGKLKKLDVLKNFTNLDPFIILERKRSPFFHRLAEGELSYICDDLSANLSRGKYKKSTIGLCLILNKQYSKALRALGGSNRERDLALVSFVARIVGDDLKADEALVAAMEQSRDESVVKFFLQARFCFDKGDVKCAAKYWQKALSFDQEAYTAHTGLARAYFEVKDQLKARTFLDRAEVFTSSYGPMIELQYRMSKGLK